MKGTLIGAIAYFVLPTDAIPDFLPVIGFTDDAAVLAAAIKLVADHIGPLHRAAARDAETRSRDSRQARLSNHGRRITLPIALRSAIAFSAAAASASG